MGTVGVGGCLSGGADGTPGQADAPPDGEATSAESAATSQECDAVSSPAPSTGEGLPDPESYPDHPSSLTAESAREYVESYETVYRHNSVLLELSVAGDCARNLDAYVTESEVTPSGQTYEVTVTTSASYTGEQCPGGTATPLPHRDLARETTSYSVTPQRLVREGTALVCSG